MRGGLRGRMAPDWAGFTVELRTFHYGRMIITYVQLSQIHDQLDIF